MAVLLMMRPAPVSLIRRMHVYDSTSIMLCAIIVAFAKIILAEDSCDSMREANNACAGKVVINVPANLVLQQPEPSILAKNLFLSTWWGNHAAFVADFTTTGMVLNSGGREGDPIYTVFGNKNIVGVIGLAVVFHTTASFISFQLYKAAQKRHGAWRFILSAAAIGLNSYFFGVNTYAAINNINLYNAMKK